MSDLFGGQYSLFDTSSLSGGSGNLFWGELEGEDEAPSLMTVLSEETFEIPRVDYRLTGKRQLGKTWKERARDNVAAIRLVAEIEDEGRAATADEQARLARFTGFGASDLANALFPRKGESFRKGWEEIGTDLHNALDTRDCAGLMRATQYAHYTPELIVHALWDTALRMGFSGGRVLEPGCGTGLFIATRPEVLEGKMAFTGIESDPVTARIARTLYPNQWIRQEDFTKLNNAERYELVIGNPPFSNRCVRGTDDLGRLRLSLHDYFIARSIEALRPGGMALFVTSRYTLDKTDPTARTYIAGLADLLGAVRLPAGSMKDDAGTDVVVDVLVFRRRAMGDMPMDEAWLETGEVPDSNQGEGPLVINRYYLEHGEQVLGATTGRRPSMARIISVTPSPA